MSSMQNCALEMDFSPSALNGIPMMSKVVEYALGSNVLVDF